MIRKCLTCDKSVDRSPSQFKTKTFCCKQYYSVWISINKRGENHPRYIGTKLVCYNCGESFIPPNGQYKRKYCSSNCYSISLRGIEPERLRKNRGVKPRTYHLGKRPKHGGAEYKEWRISVWKRDKFICQTCGKTSNELKKEKIKICADHIKPYCNYPELRYIVSNGRTLCVPCHKLTETYGIKAKYF